MNTYLLKAYLPSLIAAWAAMSKRGKKKNKLGPVGATNNLRGLAAKTKFALSYCHKK
jgi:hypothetical protein